MSKSESCCSISNYCAQIQAWWRQPINPVFLTIRDETLQREFNEILQDKYVYRFKRILVLIWVYFGYFVLGNIS